MTAAATAIVDITDIPRVAANEIASALRAVGPFARVPRLPSDLGAAEHARIETALWSGAVAAGCPSAVALRLRALTDVLGARRFARVLAEADAAVTSAILEAAAGLRLNAERGFNPTHIAWAIAAAAPVAPTADPAFELPIAA